MYDYETTLKGKVVKFRKWKVKDKKKFLTILKEEKNPGMITDALIYDCLEKPEVAYSGDELKYLLLQIRKATLGDELYYQFECPTCLEEFDYTAKISEIFTEDYKDYGDIKVGDITFTMGEINNKQYYIDTLEQCPDEETKYLADFMFHVKKLNDNDAFSFDKLYDFIEDLDVDVEREIFLQWDTMRFTVDETYDVECPHCKTSEYMLFDDLPGFFPEEWF